MHATLASDLANIDSLLEQTRRHASDALGTLDKRAVALAPPPFALQPLREDGVGLQGALHEFVTRWAPGFSGSAGPRYLGFVTGGATPASIEAIGWAAFQAQNPAVRLSGLYALVEQRDRTRSPEARSAISEQIRRRSREEENPEIRGIAGILSNESTPSLQTRAVPSRRKPFSSVRPSAGDVTEGAR